LKPASGTARARIAAAEIFQYPRARLGTLSQLGFQRGIPFGARELHSLPLPGLLGDTRYRG